MRIVNVAKVVVENQDRKVLLLRRSQTDPRRPGEWDFPGGGVDEFESHMQAAIRETREEAGLTIENPTLIYSRTELYEPKQESLNRALFHATVTEAVSGQITLSYEHDQFKWVSREQALIDFPHPFYGAGLRYAIDNGLI